MAKATEGSTYKDTEFAANWKGMEAAGIKVQCVLYHRAHTNSHTTHDRSHHTRQVRGAYHFAHPNVAASTQVDHFISTVGKMHAGDFLVLDIESANGMSPSHVASFSSEFAHLAHNKTGRPVFVYTGAWFWDPQAGGSSSCSNFPLWVSGYSSSPPMPKGWSKWTFWQFTDKASVPGIR
jgi:lysozyme